ncbi:hypothetical protein EYF80_006989 [Liparis tanakae]|uniref:Uncharacterized protein n=1 Tax=Liparis tanakae TaxID=230148 RepID=A0A4Z2IZ26_9TELE|nr:hypothetical protein EYF80_006989 [Liparis tanakae]
MRPRPEPGQEIVSPRERRPFIRFATGGGVMCSSALNQPQEKDGSKTRLLTSSPRFPLICAAPSAPFSPALCSRASARTTSGRAKGQRGAEWANGLEAVDAALQGVGGQTVSIVLVLGTMARVRLSRLPTNQRVVLGRPPVLSGYGGIAAQSLISGFL